MIVENILLFFAHFVISYSIYRFTIIFNNVSYRIGEFLTYVYLYLIITNKLDYHISAIILYLTIPLEILYTCETHMKKK